MGTTHPAEFAHVGVTPPSELEDDATQALHTFWNHRVHPCLRAAGTYAQLFDDRKLGDKRKIDVAGVTAEANSMLSRSNCSLTRHVLTNTRLDFEAGAFQVVVLAPDKEAITRANELIPRAFHSQAPRERITVTVIGNYLNSEQLSRVLFTMLRAPRPLEQLYPSTAAARRHGTTEDFLPDAGTVAPME